jgi:micrococcal nuclease
LIGYLFNTYLPTSVTPFSSPQPTGTTGLYSVLSIVDGDTIKVKDGDRSETIRLIGVDTPETVDPRKPVQCFGIEASNKVKALLTGKRVRLQSDPSQEDKDKYNRLLRYVFLEDGTNLNLLLISEGYAHEYTYDVPYALQKEFQTAEKSARENEKGLWSPTACRNN